jgi:hypothetical protein
VERALQDVTVEHTDAYRVQGLVGAVGEDTAGVVEA